MIWFLVAFIFLVPINFALTKEYNKNKSSMLLGASTVVVNGLTISSILVFLFEFVKLVIECLQKYHG